MTRMRVPEQPLVFAVRFGVVLLVLTPLVVAPYIVYPFAVGKAVWSRSMIEIAFALWAVLAVAHPAWHPPRSWLLAVLAAGLGVSVLSACFGVSVQRSLWSTYLRMQGVVDRRTGSPPRRLWRRCSASPRRCARCWAFISPSAWRCR